MPASASVPAARDPQAGSGAERNDPSSAAAGLQSVLARPAASPQAASQNTRFPPAGASRSPSRSPTLRRRRETSSTRSSSRRCRRPARRPCGSSAARICATPRCTSTRTAGRSSSSSPHNRPPLAVRNFVRLAESGFYDGLAFHRIAKGNCIQAGDPESRLGDLRKISGAGAIPTMGSRSHSRRSRVAFEKGTVALARVGDPVYMSLRSALGQTYGVDDDTKLDAKLRVEWPSALQIRRTPSL